MVSPPVKVPRVLKLKINFQKLIFQSIWKRGGKTTCKISQEDEEVDDQVDDQVDQEVNDQVDQEVDDQVEQEVDDQVDQVDQKVEYKSRFFVLIPISEGERNKNLLWTTTSRR